MEIVKTNNNLCSIKPKERESEEGRESEWEKERMIHAYMRIDVSKMM